MLISMFIRKTKTRSVNGADYFTFRLVASERVSGKVKQRTLVNLGRHFDVPASQWAMLVNRVETLLDGIQQDSLLEAVDRSLEEMAQHLCARILSAQGHVETPEATFESVDLNSLELVRPRTVGIEAVALDAMQTLGFVDKLQSLGFNRHELAASIGSIVGRLAAPGSERATRQWLGQRSALGELIDYDFTTLHLDRLYHASDVLYKHREALIEFMSEQALAFFGLTHTITLYDLTNTYFEGVAAANPQAARGHSKEKRSDCPLVTLGIALDEHGFIHRQAVFDGNVAEGVTLQGMLQGLQAPADALVVMDAGIATEKNVRWLADNGYRYLVVSRGRKRDFDAAQAEDVTTASGALVQVQRVLTASGEIELRCRSEQRAEKEKAIQSQSAEKFEQALRSLHEGLSRKRTVKQLEKIHQRIGRLKQQYARSAQHYKITVTADGEGVNATAIDWQREEKEHSQASHPGVYKLRTNIEDWDAEQLWRTYSLLTEVASVFRSLKSDLGLRPVYHRKQDRVSGHLFITVLAYQLVQMIRVRLKAAGIGDSWDQLRSTLSGLQRITASLRTEAGSTVHIRKATRAESAQQAILSALDLRGQLGPTVRTVV